MRLRFHSSTNAGTSSTILRAKACVKNYCPAFGQPGFLNLDFSTWISYVPRCAEQFHNVGPPQLRSASLCYNKMLPRSCSLSLCGSGGTGRHTILRGWRRKAWGFKSPFRTMIYCRVLKALPRNQNIARGARKKYKLMIYFITTIHVLVCFFIIIVVLLQSGKSGDISAAFGGQGSQTAFGPRGAASALSRATTWSAIAFMITSITLSVYAARRGGPTSVLQGLKSQPVKTQPAPAPTVPPAPQK